MMALAAHAAVVSGGSFTASLDATQARRSGELSRFDTRLGALTGVTLSFSGQYETMLSMTNTSTQTQTATVTSFTGLVFDSDDADLRSMLAPTQGLLAMSVGTSSQTFAPGQTLAFHNVGANRQMEVNSMAPNLLARLSQPGGGPLDMSCEAITSLSVRGGGGGSSFMQTSTGSCGATLTYTYIEADRAVPAPGTLALAGLALIGLAALTRRP